MVQHLRRSMLVSATTSSTIIAAYRKSSHLENLAVLNAESTGANVSFPIAGQFVLKHRCLFHINGCTQGCCSLCVPTKRLTLQFDNSIWDKSGVLASVKRAFEEAQIVM